MTQLVGYKTGEIQQYNPEKGLQEMAFAEVAEKYYRRAKDVEGLIRAIEEIWEQRRQFVSWWDAQGTHGGDRKSEEYQDNRSVNLKLEQFNLSPMVVSRWRQKTADPQKYQALIEKHKAKAVKIVNPTATADKHTGDAESYTPEQYVEAAREVMGDIDLDPASNETAQEIGKAAEFFTESDDGLKKDWHGCVFLNPPYSQPHINQFIEKLCDEIREGQVTEAVLLTNNSTDTNWFHLAAAYASVICFTKGRINFYKEDGEKTQPTNGQTFFYFGAKVDKFTDVFRKIGLVVRVV